MNENISKLNEAVNLLNKRGLDGLIIYSNGICNMLRPSYLYYFSGLRLLGHNNAVIISKSGDAVLLVEPEWDSIRASTKSWVSDVRGSSDFVKDLLGIMQEFGMTGIIGLAAWKEMTEELWVNIGKKVKIKLADDIVEEIARKKTKHEIDNIRNTSRIADIGFKAFLEHARTGVAEYQLSAEIEFAMRKEGADDNFNLFSSGKHNYGMHRPLDKRLEAGDIVLAEITPACEGQFVQLCRTLVLGKPSSLLAEKYNMLLYSFDQALKSMKLGSPASVLSKAMNKVISDAGYADYCYPPYMRARGHGVGVGSIAPGETIDDDTMDTLERQQVIIVHPNQYLPETGYLACGETVMVTDVGVERLANTETKLYSSGV